jgi:pSer/pThr/pTyr-binding forkhead associated (FHA) protein
MSTEVKLTIVQGAEPGKEFVFHGRAICKAGRSADCQVRLPNDLVHLDVSRHHFLLEVNPPEVCVRDMGSRNGTFVNGRKIGQRSRALAAEEALVLAMEEYPLEDGDEIRVGGTVFRVHIQHDDSSECQQADEAILVG